MTRIEAQGWASVALVTVAVGALLVTPLTWAPWITLATCVAAVAMGMAFLVWWDGA